MRNCEMNQARHNPNKPTTATLSNPTITYPYNQYNNNYPNRMAYNNPYPSHSHPPIASDLVEILNNAKYFIIKSINIENISIAKKYNQWATTVANQVKFF